MKLAKSYMWLAWLAVAVFLAGCATANKNYHGITLGGDLAFKFGSAKLTPEGKKMIDDYVEMIGRQANIRIDVVGHSDRIGNAEANRRLSLQRAQSVRAQILTSPRIDAKRVFARSVGDTEPLVECNQTNRKALIECLSPNRRVEVFVNKIPGL